MITVKSSKRGTIITILNYDAYNIPLVSDSASDLVSDSASDLEQKQETGNGNKETGIGKGSTTHFRSPSGEQKKHAASASRTGQGAATSPAQALFLVDRELAEVNESIGELDDLNKPVPRALRERRRDLEKKRANILTGERPNA